LELIPVAIREFFRPEPLDERIDIFLREIEFFTTDMGRLRRVFSPPRMK
jgi:hypothetical protein